MNKKLMAVAVAGVFAAPAAFAQVTVSGKLGIQLTNMSIGNLNAARVAGANSSTTIVNDNASILRIGAQEDLGGGLQAFGQYEFRPNLDGSNTGVTTSLPVGSTTGVSFIGLRSNSWGQVRAGTMATWCEGLSSQGGYGLSTEASQHYSLSGMSCYVMTGQTTGAVAAYTGSTTSFSSSRQPNVIMYETPKMGGFSAQLGWASSPMNNVDNDLNLVGRKGRAWYIMPAYDAGFVKFGYALADIKDNSTPAANSGALDLKAHKLYAQFSIAGVEIAPAWAKVVANQGIAAGGVAAGTRVVDTRKWWLPIRYKTGNNVFGFLYMKNGDDKVQVGDQGAKQTALSYNYLLSNRTNIGVSWISLKNNAQAQYDITSLTSNAYGAAGGSLQLGEKMNVLALSLNHNF